VFKQNTCRNLIALSLMACLIPFYQNCTNDFQSTAASTSNPSSDTGANIDCQERLGTYCKPNTSNTGRILPNVALTAYVDYSTQNDGQVIENGDFSGCLSIRHKNVIIRNSVIRGYISSSGDACSGVDGSSVSIQDSELISAGGLGGGVSLYRNYIHQLRDADFWRNPYNAVWESNYFEDWVATSTTPHMDAIQWWWNTANPLADVNLVVRGNRWNIDNVYPLANQYNAILFMGGNGPMQDNITWEYNWMKSGGYSLRMAGATGRLRINHNIFEGWGWGPVLYGEDYNVMRNNPNFEFIGNQVLSNSILLPFDKPCQMGGSNMNLFSLIPYFVCP
jgi:hypothetical protein